MTKPALSAAARRQAFPASARYVVVIARRVGDEAIQNY
jgi:hypothetical protein